MSSIISVIYDLLFIDQMVVLKNRVDMGNVCPLTTDTIAYVTLVTKEIDVSLVCKYSLC